MKLKPLLCLFHLDAWRNLLANFLLVGNKKGVPLIHICIYLEHIICWLHPHTHIYIEFLKLFMELQSVSYCVSITLIIIDHIVPNNTELLCDSIIDLD